MTHILSLDRGSHNRKEDILMRSRLTWQIPSLCLLLLVAAAPLVRAADPPTLEISTVPGGPPGPVVVSFEPGQSEATVPLFIGLTGDEGVEGVRLYGQLTDCAGRPLSVGQVEFLQADAAAPLGGLALDPGSGQQRARLRISDLGERYGHSCGYLAAEIGSSHQLISQLTVDRPGTPVLAIREANDQGEIRLVTHQPVLDDALLLSEAGGTAGVQEINLSLSSLRAEGGDTIGLEIQPSIVNLQPGSSQLVRLGGEVPAVASYRGLLRVRWATGQEEYELTVERKASPQVVELAAVAPVPSTRIPILSNILGVLPDPSQLPRFLARRPGVERILSFRGGDVEIPLQVRETVGAPAVVYYPVLTHLNRVAEDATETQATYSGWFLRDCDGKRIDMEGQPGGQTMLHLSSYGSQCLRLVISGLQQAGSYKAAVSVASPGGAENAIDVVVRVRDHWVVAALVILLGVLASYQLRHWLEIGRPGQINRLTIGRLARLVRDKLLDPKFAVRAALLARLDEIAQLQQVDPSADVGSMLEEVQTQLNDALVVRTVVELDLQHVVAREHLDEAAQEMAQIQEMLDTADPLGALAEAKSLAEALRAKINAWNRARLKEGLQKLQAAVQADLEGLQELAVSAQHGALQSELVAIQTRLADAAGQVETQPKRAGALYEEARTRYARAAAERLRLVLEGQRHPPGFPDEAAWAQVRDALLQELSVAEEQAPDESRQTVDRVRRQYLEQIISHLEEDARSLAEQYEAVPNAEAKQTAFEGAAKQLAEALQLLPSDPDAAEVLYCQARDDYLAQLTDEERGRLQDAEGRLPAGAPAPAPGGGSDPGGTPGRPFEAVEEVGAELDPGRILREIERKDRQALYIVSVVSVLVGLQALWVTNSTFGGLVAYITVFLWGFGLHELNKVALPAAVQRLQLPWYPVTKQPGQE
jgi:hypothetical protein